MNKAEAHPDAAQLAAFALGHLPPAVQEEVAGHVAACEECCKTLSQVPEDSFLGRLRKVSVSGVPAELADHPRYRIVSRLGEGGMGTVYKAEHRMMERAVALKVIGWHLVSNPRAVERFRQEVRAAAKLSHPNIVVAYDAEQAGDVHFLVMEYVDGRSLARLVEKKGPLEVAHACWFIRQAALGLQHAHEQGMVHRDIKPGNLMVTRKGLVKVLDFGLARLVQDADDTKNIRRPRTLTGPDIMLGTPDFLPPEQAADSRAVDGRSDLYSLGCTLYYLLTGQVPFPGGSSVAKLYAHTEVQAVPVEELRREVPVELGNVVRKLMAKKPEDRYQKASDAAAALAPFGRHGGALSVEPLVPSEPVSPSERHPSGNTERMSAASMETPTLELPERKQPAAPARRPRHFAAKAACGVLGIALALLIFAMTNRKQDKEPQGNLGGKPAGKRAVMILPYRGFHSMEYQSARNALEAQGIEVRVAAVQFGMAKPVRSAFPPGASGPEVEVDLLIHNVKVRDYDAFVFCGGPGTRDMVGDNGGAAPARRLIEQVLETGKPLAAIGEGIAILADTGALDGKETAGPVPLRIEPAIKEKGAVVGTRPVVRTGSILTCRGGRDADELAAELSAVLKR